jgi:hypothetical protein
MANAKIVRYTLEIIMGPIISGRIDRSPSTGGEASVPRRGSGPGHETGPANPSSKTRRNADTSDTEARIHRLDRAASRRRAIECARRDGPGSGQVRGIRGSDGLLEFASLDRLVDAPPGSTGWGTRIGR